jgi:fructokinase
LKLFITESGGSYRKDNNDEKGTCCESFPIMKNNILCIGEILWDSMPAGLFLGGAPYNVGYHLNKLGEQVFIVSRVGRDDLGYEAVKRAKLAGVSTELVQFDDELSTGFVEVNLGEKGIPDYNIKKPVAWDNIEPEPNVLEQIKSAGAVVFGTLAQRSATSKKTIQSISSANCLKVLDLNLRFPHADRKVVEQSLKIADILKLNHEELEQLEEWFGLSGDFQQNIRRVAQAFALQLICVTRGGDGAVLWSDGRFYEAEGHRVDVADTVGSGDAFLAVIVSGYLAGLQPEKLIDYSNRLGAYIATKSGSTPQYSIQSIEEIAALSLQGGE